MSSWYYARGGVQQGPVDLQTLRGVLARGEIGAEDLVWREGMPDWQPAGRVPELAMHAAPAPDAGTYAIAPEVPPAYPQVAHQPSYGPGPYAPAGPASPYAVPYYTPRPLEMQTVYAGFWLRFAAWIIDYLVTLVGGFCIGGVVGFFLGISGAMRLDARGHMPPEFEAMFNLIGVVCSWLYYALMESSLKQGTLGKMALGLIVTDVDGQRIGFGRATGRFFGKIISGLILLIGFMMAGWTERKQALHDMMAGTLVLKRR